jgi:hypothetical protein
MASIVSAITGLVMSHAPSVTINSQASTSAGTDSTNSLPRMVTSHQVAETERLPIKIPSNLMPETFKGDGKVEIELWLKQFEHYCQLYAWSPEERKKVLPLLLKEKAQEWFDGLSDQEKNTYDAMVEALKLRYRPHDSLKWVRLQQFKERKQQPGEPIEDFIQCIKRMGLKLGKSEKDIMETVVAGLTPAISKFVMLKNPKNLQEAADYAMTAAVLEPKQADVVAIAALNQKMDSVLEKQSRPLPRTETANKECAEYQQ